MPTPSVAPPIVKLTSVKRTSVKHLGGCHCRRVRFEVRAPASIEVLDCNCSMCARVGGFLHLIVRREDFRLLCGEQTLTRYAWNTGTAQHLFCSVCGIKSFYVPRSHPDGISVSARCIDPGTVEALHVVPFDGAHWEDHAGELSSLDGD